MICDRRIEEEWKKKNDKIVVRPAMLYVLEMVTLTKRQAVELKMKISIGSDVDEIRHEYIRGTAQPKR